MKNPMKSPILYFMAGMALLFTACSSDNDQAQEEAMPIRLTANVAQVTTRADVDIQNQQFLANKKVKVYAEENKDNGVASTKYAEGGYVFVASGSGALYPETGAYPYYPTSSNTVALTGYAPYTDTKKVTKATTSFSVASDQRDESSYIDSDLMFSNNITNQGKSSSPVQMTFNHKMTKIIVKLKAYNPDNDESQQENLNAILIGSIVTLKNVAKTVTFNPTTGGVSNPTNVGDIELSNDGYYQSAAIIAPQTVAQQSLFIQIKMKTGGDIMDFRLPQQFNFAEGMAYTFTITVRQDAIVVGEYTIEDWIETPVTTTTGTLLN